LGQPVQRRDDHVLETARLDVDHQSQRRALLSLSGTSITILDRRL
jgi:hypothetical protein